MECTIGSDHPPMAGWHEKLTFLNIDAATRHRLAAFLFIRPARDFPSHKGKKSEYIDGFYGHIVKWPGLNSMIGDPGNIPRLKQAQTTHWRHLSGGRFGETYRNQAQRGVGRLPRKA